MELILNVVETVFKAYGLGFGMIIVGGCAVACFIELTIKLGFNWIENNTKDEKVRNVIPLIRFFSIFIVSVVLTYKVSAACVEQFGLPALGFNRFVWFVWCYAAQFIFSMYGIKGFLAWKDERKARAEDKQAAKEEARRNQPQLEKVEGHSYYIKRDANGNVLRDDYGRELLFDAKGKKL